MNHKHRFLFVGMIIFTGLVMSLLANGQTYTLTTSASPTEGGSVSPVPGNHVYAEGTVVDLVAVESPGWDFNGWTGNVLNVNNATTTITMNSDETVAATFVAENLPPTVGDIPNQSIAEGATFTTINLDDYRITSYNVCYTKLLRSE